MAKSTTNTKRRTKGDGTIVKRPDGRWMGSIDLGWVEGKRKRKSIYGKTKQEVAQKLRELKYHHDRGVNIAPERQTVAQFMERWLNDVAAVSVRPRTMENYRRITTKHVVPHIGPIPPAKLAAQDVQRMLRALEKQGLSPVTVSNVRTVLIGALNIAVKWDLVVRNVAALTTPPRVAASKHYVLTPAEAHRLLAAARGTRHYALWLMAVSLGMRRGELLGLRWQDVDFERGTLRVAQTLQIVGNKPVFGAPKTDNSKRTIYLLPTLITALHEHRAQQLQARLLAGSAWHDYGLVFPSTIGTPQNMANLWEAFRNLTERAGVPPIHLHDLRHSCATFLAQQGVPPRTMMEILGHSDLSTTMQIYTHVLDEGKQDAMRRMDALLNLQDVG